MGKKANYSKKDKKINDIFGKKETRAFTNVTACADSVLTQY